MRQLKISATITNKSADQLSKYLNDISKCTTISSEQEVALAKRIQNGDQQAKEELVKANLRFVVSVAKQFQGYGLPLADLINEGNIGLIEAAGRFDHSRGFKFISFAVWWIRQSILQAISEQSKVIRIPYNKLMLQNKVKNCQMMLEQKLGRPADNDEVAESLQLPLEDVQAVMAIGQPAVSLDAPVGDQEEGSLIDILQDPNETRSDNQLHHVQSLKKELKRAFGTLAKRERQTICYYFGIGLEYPMSLEAIADKLHVSPERARQIKDKALRIISHNKNTAQLRSYLS